MLRDEEVVALQQAAGSLALTSVQARLRACAPALLCITAPLYCAAGGGHPGGCPCAGVRAGGGRRGPMGRCNVV